MGWSPMLFNQFVTPRSVNMGTEIVLPFEAAPRPSQVANKPNGTVSFSSPNVHGFRGLSYIILVCSPELVEQTAADSLRVRLFRLISTCSVETVGTALQTF